MSRLFSLTVNAAMAALVLLLLPVVHAALLGVNLIIHLFVLGLQVVMTRMHRERSGPLRSVGSQEPFVSIIVPSHNEPPEILIATLRCLAKIRWSKFEVLVVDNNTSDRGLWEPVQRECQRLGPRFRFLHVEGLKGFKAGALNWAIPQADLRAEFFFVVDADYQVRRDVLIRAIGHARDPRVAMVQFPQDYRNITPSNRGVALEFRHFFSGYMAMADRLGCVPSTGTLTLLRAEALRAVGDFDETVVTEDAELGLRFALAGWRSVFADEPVGKGLMPHSVEDLRKQRWRWAFGNAQILRRNLGVLIMSRHLAVSQKLGWIAVLTAWFNFNLIPSLSLVVLSTLPWVGWRSPIQPYLLLVSGFTVLTYFLIRFMTLFQILHREGYGLRDILSAFATHAGLGWIFSTSWPKCLWRPDEPFLRTNKFLRHTGGGVWRFGFFEIGTGLLYLSSAGLLAAADFVVVPICAGLMFATRLAFWWVGVQVRRTLEITERLAESLNPNWDSIPVTEGMDSSRGNLGKNDIRPG